MEFESLSDLLKWQPPKQREVISHGILPAGGKLVLAGAESTLKTMLSTYAGFYISLGLPLLGFKTFQTKVGLIQAELTKAMFRDRIEQLVKLHKVSLADATILFSTASELKLNKPAGLAQLVSAVRNANIGLLIIDPLYKVLQGNISDWEQMMRMIDNLDYIGREFSCAIWLVHHRRKSLLLDGEPIDLGTDELIGSSALKNWADTILRVSLSGEDKLLLEFSKARNAKVNLQPAEVAFSRHDLSFKLLLPELTARELRNGTV